MRIGIDIRSLQNDSQLRGIGTYTRCLVKAVLEADRVNEYVFFAFKGLPVPDFLREGVFEKARIERLTRRQKHFVWMCGQFLFPYAARKERLDLFYSPEYIVPVLARAKKVITVHDFINSDYPLYHKRNLILRRIYYRLKDKTLHKADKVISVSHYTKEKIRQLCGIDESRIAVIHEAAQDCFRPVSDSDLFARTREKYGIDARFILYAGALDYHKNIDGLIKAFSRIKDKEAALVLAGVKNDPRYFESIQRLIADLHLERRVLLLGYIPQEDLVSLYNMAESVISVSFYEGFGLPVIEAMACAKPVIASGNTSMAEIVGDCGILVNPHNLEEITAAMDSLLSNEGLRKTLAEKGFERSKEFSWEKAARQMLGVWEELVG